MISLQLDETHQKFLTEIMDVALRSNGVNALNAAANIGIRLTEAQRVAQVIAEAKKSEVVEDQAVS